MRKSKKPSTVPALKIGDRVLVKNRRKRTLDLYVVTYIHPGEPAKRAAKLIRPAKRKK